MFCTNFLMATRSLSLGRKETRLFGGFHSSHCRLNSCSPQSLVLFISTRFLTPNSFQDNLRPILSTSSRCWLFAVGLFTAALDPHRIIFGNYSRYSNSKRALPFNGPEKNPCDMILVLVLVLGIPPNDPLKT